MRPRYPKVESYVFRPDFIVEQCKEKRILDIGMVGEPCATLSTKVTHFDGSLHLRINEVAEFAVGLDIDADAVAHLQDRYRDLHLIVGNIETTETVIGAPFDVVVAGDIFEHLSSPGKALTNMCRLLKDGGRLIMSVPNAFGLPNYLRFLAGRFVDGPDHVHTYTKYTLHNFLWRHGFSIMKLHTGLDKEPASRRRRWAYRFLKQPLRLLPDLGGTLIAVAEPIATCTEETPSSEDNLRLGNPTV